MLGTVATSAFAAAAAVFVVALAFAFYALLEPLLGRAGAAASLAGVIAVLMALGGVFIGAGSRGKAKKPPPPVAGRSDAFIERAFDFVRDKPAVAIVAALAAGFMAVRNPGYLGAALRSFLEGQEPPKR
jgi:drug/metabolite transporter (DMT)-like permease